ncbi:MAG: transglycosylase domain-containing protein [Candidatus Wildermuthbacteria bacterium]|nr:transglycosylase domain-containing protein [Candidatus Wildermuthbacteria bacterium]
MKIKHIAIGLAILGIIVFGATSLLANDLDKRYESGQSRIIYDRSKNEIAILPNSQGHYARYSDSLPLRLQEILIKKEDKFFFWHLGINPWSIGQNALSYIGLSERKGSSTITQQLAKTLLQNENSRSPKNILTEALYAFSLELHKSKKEILTMYANSAYFGNHAQGISEASRLYFGADPNALSEGQMLQLLSTLNQPAYRNPSNPINAEFALGLADRVGIDHNSLYFVPAKEAKENMQRYDRQDVSYFELSSFGEGSSPLSCQSTLDIELTREIREIARRNIDELWTKNARHAAVVVIKIPENEIIALIGSPDPHDMAPGYQINMAKEPRQIGSTIKPFIYLKAFEQGLRPYSLVDDREYKYITALGFPLYPKNFDYQYRGEVSLHYALSNSLNVPAVKTLEYVGLENFYGFLQNDFEFLPVQPFENYQLGIALGTLEMSLLDLSNYFTIFANHGELKPATLFYGKECSAFSNSPKAPKQISNEPYVQLVNKILNDRKTGIEQFGLKSDLNLFQNNYALKTGTSRDFRDSWIVGYTPDFLVGVWVGNADLSPTESLSGQAGAGRIWSEAMELLFHSPYNKKTPLPFNLVEEFKNSSMLEYGLKNDNYDQQRLLLKQKDFSLVLSPYNGDRFLLSETKTIQLKGKRLLNWTVNGEFLAFSKETTFTPQIKGTYTIEAADDEGNTEKIAIFVAE